MHEILDDIAQNSNFDVARIAACREVLNRLEGVPAPQQPDEQDRISEMSDREIAEELLEIEQKLAAFANDPDRAPEG